MKEAGRGLFRLWSAYRRDTRGAAAVELALLLTFLTIPLLNIIDLAFYVYWRMQTENAAQAGAQTAWATCSSPPQWPATNTNLCPGLSAAVTSAIASTSLGAGVTQAAGSPAEGYYCATTSGALTLVGTAGTVGSPPSGAPNTCAAVPGASAPSAGPGDYIQISVSYAYSPLVSGVSVASLLPSPITKTTRARLD
jgi:hypothetical protein